MKTLKKRLIIFIALLVSLIILQIDLRAEQAIKVEVYGTGKNTLILIPGLTCPGEVWTETIARYKDRYSCHVISLPGFAGQPALETDQYLLAMRDQIIDYIQSHKLNKPVMMGHSLGGFLSLWIASVQPDLVGDLIIVDALPFFPAIQNPEATPESMKPVAANMRKMMASATTEQVKQSQQYFLSTIATSPENLALIGKWGVESHQPTVAQAMYEMQTIDLRDQIEPVKSRVLVMGAWIAYKQYGVTHDSTMKNFATQYQKISSVDIKLTDTAKHFIMFDEPKWFYQQIDSFLNLNKKSSE